jgi:hypothetical protein
MPSPTSNVQKETPKRVRHSFGNIIGRLNAQWSLDLPTLHGTQQNALDQADAADTLAKQCAGRIRFLCYRDCQLEKVISDFDEDGRRICSEWVWKPSQEAGTLPNMPVTKSFISTTPKIPRKHRRPLLQRLFDLLDEEFKLARESEVYRRTSFAEIPAAAAAARGGESQDRTTSDIGAQTTAANPTRRQAAETPLASVEERRLQGRLQDRRSLESVKRKSSGSQKV